MYFSNSALAAVCTIVALVKAQEENNESDEQDNPAKKEENKANIYTELSDFYTFVALIDIVFKDHTKRTCTGAIIHDNVVITAAHCFLGRNRYTSSKPELTASFVVIGTKAMFETGYEQYLPIEKIIDHPMFEGWTADLALVFTFAGMTSDKPGSIIPLAGDLSAHVDSNVTVYSWGEESEDEENSDEPLPKKKRKKTTAPESCSEDDESGTGHKHKNTKSPYKRFRNSGGDGEKSIERLGMKRTAMFYGNRLWSRGTDLDETTATFSTKNEKFYKTKSLHQRAEEDETNQRDEDQDKQSTNGFNNQKYSRHIEPKLTKPTPNDDDSNNSYANDYYELIVDEREARTTKRKSRYLADVVSVSRMRVENSSIKPYKFGETIDFKDSYEKALVKKHFASSKSTKNINNSKKHTKTTFESNKDMSRIYKRGYPKRDEGKGRHFSRETIKHFNIRKKIKTLGSVKERKRSGEIYEKEDRTKGWRRSFQSQTGSVKGRDKTGEKFEKEKPQGWRRSLGSQQNQLFVGSFGYVNIQGCRALVEKAMPAKYEISKGNDAICYTSTKRCISENDSGAPAVRQGRLIAVTVGGAQCEGDHVAVGMKMNCYCSWISDNLPSGSPKFECCKNCCDLKHKEIKDDKSKSKEKSHKSNKYKKHRQRI